ncbi:MAG TPA: efflux transporter outer membrane subunit [Verrucomicrobiae bacterium]|jgi:multidrug efflux system outer membrane protein
MNKYFSSPAKWFVLAVLTVTGCTMVPHYDRPAPGISTAWPKVPGYAKSPTHAAPAAADIGWREFFRDARLQQLIGLALTNNPNLRAAVLNVAQMRALYHVQGDALIPTVAVDAQGSRQRTPNFFGANGKAFTYSEYSVDLGITSYEVDLFGRIRSLKRQALETYFATEEAQRSAQIALVANVASAYLADRQANEQLAVERRALKAAQQTYDLTKSSVDAGVLSQNDLDLTIAQLQTAHGLVAGYEQQSAEANDNLVLLLGEPLPADLPAPKSFNPQLCLSDIPAGLPSDLLERRPDVLESEHQLKAANANIGAARAAFFPTITLTASGGSASGTLENLFAPGSSTWALSPQLYWPIFAAGTAYDQLQADKATKEMDAANYQSTVQTAFREVADALAVRVTVQTQLKADQAVVKADQESFDLTMAGFQGGVNSTFDVCTAEETLDTAQQNLIQTQYARLVSLINLYQALGGGWNENTPEPDAVSKNGQ